MLKDRIDDLESQIEHLKHQNEIYALEKKQDKAAFSKKVLNPEIDETPALVQLNKMNLKLAAENNRLK